MQRWDPVNKVDLRAEYRNYHGFGEGKVMGKIFFVFLLNTLLHLGNSKGALEVLVGEAKWAQY